MGMLQVDMLPDELPAIAVEPELLKDLEAVLFAGETLEDFMVAAVRDEVVHRLRLGAGRSGPDDVPPRGD